MHLNCWKARRAGGRITINGTDDNGMAAKIVGVDVIEPRGRLIVAVDKDGGEHILRTNIRSPRTAAPTPSAAARMRSDEEFEMATDQPPAPNPPAFPHLGNVAYNSDWITEEGLSLRDWFAGQALANPNICTGKAPDWQLQIWFGNRIGLYAWEIAAKQARVFADAMLAVREDVSERRAA